MWGQVEHLRIGAAMPAWSPLSLYSSKITSCSPLATLMIQAALTSVPISTNVPGSSGVYDVSLLQGWAGRGA